jgi:hypothetical protein
MMKKLKIILCFIAVIAGLQGIAQTRTEKDLLG